MSDNGISKTVKRHVFGQWRARHDPQGPARSASHDKVLNLDLLQRVVKDCEEAGISPFQELRFDPANNNGGTAAIRLVYDEVVLTEKTEAS